MGLRKEKAARLKLAILDGTLKLIGKKSFDDLLVDEICAKVKISKVTLFKYFPQKEDILLYYFRLWCLKRAVELNDKPKEGLTGIIFLFDKLSEDAETHPGVILSLFAYLADLRRTLRPFPVKVEEKKLLFPELENIGAIEIQSVDQMLEKFSLEAIFKKGDHQDFFYKRHYPGFYFGILWFRFDGSHQSDIHFEEFLQEECGISNEGFAIKGRRDYFIVTVRVRLRSNR